MAAPVLLPPPTHASEAGHWYDRSGREAHEVLAKGTGLPRPTTLRDARQLELVPSVTTIIKCAASPGLELWKQEQMLLAALTLPRTDAEAERDWLARIKQDSQEQGRAAAERGTEIHAAIEAYFRDPFVGLGRLEDAVMEVRYSIEDRFPDIPPHHWETELSFAHPFGFGGKCDLAYQIDGPGIVLDVKSKDNWPESRPPIGFDEHAMQLAAYRVGLGRPEATCANLYVSRQEPWQVHIHEWTEADLERAWAMFQALLAYWKASAKYDPAWQESGDAIPF